MFGGRVAVHSIGMYVYCACVCHTVHVGVSMNTVPLYHWSSLLHVHVHCMLQFSHFVLIPPSSAPCPFGGFPCGLSRVDLFEAERGHPVPSEFVASSEGAVQPEGTWTELGVFVG